MTKGKTINRYFSAILPLIFAVMSAASASAQNATLDGTVSGEINTDKGKVKVYLPDDMRAGDTISGTIVGEEKREGAKVDVNGKQYPLKDGTFTFVIPTIVPRVIKIVLKDAAGRKIGRTEIPVFENSAIGNSPRFGQTGRGLPIPGNFDGSAETTNVSIGGRSIPIIAESPRKIVVQIPADAPNGRANIEIKENLSPQTQQTNQLKINIVSIELTADKLNLQRGEKTDLRIRVNGLEGLEREKVFVEVQNRTPSVATLNLSGEWQPSGGNSFIMPIAPGKKTAGDLAVFNNSYEFNGNLTGVQNGGFTIYASVWSDYLDSLRSEAVHMTLEELDAKLEELGHQLEEEGKKSTESAEYKRLKEKFDVYLAERRRRKSKSPS